jgi:hypothetical protein
MLPKYLLKVDVESEKGRRNSEERFGWKCEFNIYHRYSILVPIRLPYSTPYRIPPKKFLSITSRPLLIFSMANYLLVEGPLDPSINVSKDFGYRIYTTG